MKTRSVTLRLPADVLEAIEQKSGKGKRSEFIIQTLRESLGIESQLVNADPKALEQVADLLHQFEAFKDQISHIVNRIEKLEEESVSPAPAEIDAIAHKPTKKAGKGNTESKTESQTTCNTETLESNMLIDVPDETPKGSESIEENEFLESLQKDDPVRQWNKEKLRNYRRRGQEKRRHSAGSYGFIYKGKEGQCHEWWVWRENLPHTDF